MAVPGRARHGLSVRGLPARGYPPAERSSPERPTVTDGVFRSREPVEHCLLLVTGQRKTLRRGVRRTVGPASAAWQVDLDRFDPAPVVAARTAHSSNPVRMDEGPSGSFGQDRAKASVSHPASAAPTWA